MMKLPSGRSAAFAIAMLACSPPLALAQSATAPAGAPHTDTGAQQRVEARINQLHGQLRITAAQDAQWKAFADTMRANARDMDAMAEQRGAQLPTMNALQDMQSYEQLAEAHVEHLKKLIPAFEALYNAMTPEQQKVADNTFRATSEQRAQGGAPNR